MVNNKYYVWSDGSTGTKESKYKVTSLSTVGSPKPTLERTPATFIGKNCRGSYNYPFSPGSVLNNHLPNTLSNGEQTTLEFVLIEGPRWPSSEWSNGQMMPYHQLILLAV